MKWYETYCRLAGKISALWLGIATEEEREDVEKWEKEKTGRKELVEDLLDQEKFRENEMTLNKFPVQEAWARMEKRLRGTRRRWRLVLEWGTYAAVFAVLLGAGYFLFRERPLEVKVTKVAAPVFHSGVQGARLTLGNGRVVEVTRDNQFQLAEMDGTLIRKDSLGVAYNPDASTGDTLVYNRMETLTGMEYTLALADGTLVYLNAETSLRYPVVFREGERVVELEGEAYFEVAKDEMRPFIVRMNGSEIKVTGTSFNARAYGNEDEVVTTLVEGKVEVNGRKIVPGEQVRCEVNTGNLTVKTVDVNRFIAWKEGYFVFRNERLEDVMKTLARWYGVEYHFLDEQSKNVRIGARFGRYDDMTPIIEMLRQTELVNVLQTNCSLYISQKK